MLEKSSRILALDDDPVSLLLVQHTLRTLGFGNVRTCRSGAQALEHFDLDGERPALVLLDLNMPGMDGLEFVRHLVSRGYGGHLILCSGENSRVLQTAQTLVQAHRISVLGQIRKPVTAERLSALLENSTDTQPQRAASRSYPANALREAISAGQLVNHYQPQIDLHSGRVVGVEALVRWQHPTDGLVGPDRFIGVAEANGLIDALTSVVFGDAVAQSRRWHDAGFALRCSVNLSMASLQSLDFADFVIGQTARHAVDPAAITLEITESQLMHDMRAPLEVLTRLRMKRFGLSIDDFGTGHSSMAQLRDIPFDELKIDRGFVHRASDEPTRRAIYDASLRLARQLEMTVVAEGVENHADWTFVQSTGCDTAQGYFIARPMPADAIMPWLHGWRMP